MIRCRTERCTRNAGRGHKSCGATFTPTPGSLTPPGRGVRRPVIAGDKLTPSGAAYRCGEQQACSSALTGDAHALPISALEQESGIYRVSSPGCPGHFPQNRTCAVHIRLFG
jgi:hypothetical protein